MAKKRLTVASWEGNGREVSVLRLLRFAFVVTKWDAKVRLKGALWCLVNKLVRARIMNLIAFSGCDKGGARIAQARASPQAGCNGPMSD